MSKEWKVALKEANKRLKEKGYKLLIIREDENSFDLDIYDLNKKKGESYASGYFEDELCSLIEDAVTYIDGKTNSKKEFIYVVSCDAPILEEKEFNKITDEEIEEMYDAGSDYVDQYDDIHELAANWNTDEIFYPSNSYMRIIEE